MPIYYRHPADWEPERVERAARAVDAIENLQLPSTSGCTCSTCKAQYDIQLAIYTTARNAYMIDADLLIDPARQHSTPAAAACAKQSGEAITYYISDLEREQWRYREQCRFQDGTYTHVPWHAIEPRDAHRYPHLSMKNPSLIAYTKSDEHGVADRQTAIKPGRYLQEFFGDLLTAEQIRDYVSRCQGITFDLQLAMTADDILRVYRGGPSSCMSHPPGGYSSPVHPVTVYGDSDLAVAYYGPIDNASARAVVWPARKIYSRIYGGVETLRAILQREGYRAGSIRGACVRAIRHGSEYVMPYIDGIEGAKTITRNGQTWIKLGSGPIDTSSTYGLGSVESDDDDQDDDDTWSCEHCESVYYDDAPQYELRYVLRGFRRTRTICAACHDELTIVCADCVTRILCDDAYSHDHDALCSDCYNAREHAAAEPETAPF